MIKLDCTAPADAREQAYALLSGKSPTKVLIDTDLRQGEWYVVRAPQGWERERLLGDQAPAPSFKSAA